MFATQLVVFPMGSIENNIDCVFVYCEEIRQKPVIFMGTMYAEGVRFHRLYVFLYFFLFHNFFFYSSTTESSLLLQICYPVLISAEGNLYF